MYERKHLSIFKESAFTLSHRRTYTFSFGKAARFLTQKKTSNASYIFLPSTLSGRGTSQGYGKRWSPVDSRVKTPAPGTYSIPSTSMSKTGPRYVKSSIKSSSFEESPGPGSYDPAQPIGKNAPKFSFRPQTLRTNFSLSPCPKPSKKRRSCQPSPVPKP